MKYGGDKKTFSSIVLFLLWHSFSEQPEQPSDIIYNSTDCNRLRYTSKQPVCWHKFVFSEWPLAAESPRPVRQATETSSEMRKLLPN